MINAKSQMHKNYIKIAAAIEYIASFRHQQPSLSEVASAINLSDYHFQRVFSEWVGISPKQFLQVLTKEYAKSQLQANSVLVSAYESGLSSGGRLHDLMVTYERMTPGEYKQKGAGLTIEYGVSDSPFGPCFIAKTQRGLCQLAFFDYPSELQALEQQLMAEWSAASLVANNNAIETIAHSLFEHDYHQKVSLHLLLKGTDFQVSVWEALLSIPDGALCSYQQVAEMIGKPSSVRATASAIARNNISYLIPCHRVIKSTGEFNQYRWGKYRKQAMLVWEAELNKQ